MLTPIQRLKNFIILTPDATKEQLINECERLEKEFQHEIQEAFYAGSSHEHKSSKDYFDERYEVES